MDVILGFSHYEMEVCANGVLRRMSGRKREIGSNRR